MSARSLRRYAAASLLALAVFAVLPDGSWGQTAAFVAVGLAAAGAVLAGIRINRPVSRVPWMLFAVGIALNALGSLVDALLWNLRGQGFPSAADVFYFGLYPALVLGLLLLIRRTSPHGDWAAAVDATTISTGLGLLSWVFIVRPGVGDDTLSVIGRALSVAYPVGDVLLLAMLVRLGLSAARTEPALRFVAAGLVLFLADDTTWAVINRIGWEPGTIVDRLLQAVVLGGYLSVGAAALHWSMRRASTSDTRQQALGPMLLAFLTLASLIAPAILLVEALRGQVTDGLAIAFCSAALFLLVVTRMAQLLHQVERQSRQLRRLALFDDLTGLPNRRTWSTELSRGLERARRDESALSVAMLDLDGFKEFNDGFGHLAGDRLLREAAAAWAGKLRSIDSLGRYGGDEFIVTLERADTDEATEVVERMRAVVPLGQTFSAGVATWDRYETSAELVARADAALYQAKRGGRDCTVVADVPGRPSPAPPASVGVDPA